jgi:hypothetical protein
VPGANADCHGKAPRNVYSTKKLITLAHGMWIGREIEKLKNILTWERYPDYVKNFVGLMRYTPKTPSGYWQGPKFFGYASAIEARNSS